MSEMLDHNEWEERLQDRIDGDLDPAQCVALDEHLGGCPACQARMRVLRTLDAALCERFPQEALAASFDRAVLGRITLGAQADRAAAQARAEQEWEAQMAALSRQWRDALRSLALNLLAGAALIITFAKALSAALFIHRVFDQAWLLAQQATVRPAMTLPVAAGLTIAALWLVRTLASTNR